MMRKSSTDSSGIPFLELRAVHLIFLAVITLLWSFPLWYTAGKTGGQDWGYMINQWEVRWLTVFNYHQWPAFNPWQGGGTPIAPAPNLVSVQAALTFVFGAKAGISLYVAFLYLLGAWGFYNLGLLLFSNNRPAAFYLGLIGPAAPALAFHLMAGHVGLAAVMIWPAIFYYFLSADNDRLSGIKAGLFYSLSFNENPFYITQYGTLCLAIGYIAKMLGGPAQVRRDYLRFAGFMAFTSLPLIAPVVVNIANVAAGYTRSESHPASYTFRQLFSYYLEPVTTNNPYEFYVGSIKSTWSSFQNRCYLGFIAIGFWLTGVLISRVRWFHFAMIGGVLLAMGNLYWWQPMRWLMLIPPFSSLESFPRFRLFVCLFFALGSAWGLFILAKKYRERLLARRLIYTAAFAGALEIISVSHMIARGAHFPYQLPPVVNERGGDFYQISYRKRLPDFVEGWPADLYLYTRANVGLVSEPAAIASQFRFLSGVKTVDATGYTGEFVQNGLPVKPDFWSPNRITFSRLDPAFPVSINLNRGKPWKNFGRELFPADRIVEFNKPFLVHPDSSGRIVLTYEFTRMTLILILQSIAGIVLIALLWLLIRKARAKTLGPANLSTNGKIA